MTVLARFEHHDERGSIVVEVDDDPIAPIRLEVDGQLAVEQAARLLDTFLPAAIDVARRAGVVPAPVEPLPDSVMVDELGRSPEPAQGALL